MQFAWFQALGRWFLVLVVVTFFFSQLIAPKGNSEALEKFLPIAQKDDAADDPSREIKLTPEEWVAAAYGPQGTALFAEYGESILPCLVQFFQVEELHNLLKRLQPKIVLVCAYALNHPQVFHQLVTEDKLVQFVSGSTQEAIQRGKAVLHALHTTPEPQSPDDMGNNGVLNRIKNAGNALMTDTGVGEKATEKLIRAYSPEEVALIIILACHEGGGSCLDAFEIAPAHSQDKLPFHVKVLDLKRYQNVLGNFLVGSLAALERDYELGKEMTVGTVLDATVEVVALGLPLFKGVKLIKARRAAKLGKVNKATQALKTAHATKVAKLARTGSKTVRVAKTTLVTVSAGWAAYTLYDPQGAFWVTGQLGTLLLCGRNPSTLCAVVGRFIGWSLPFAILGIWLLPGLLCGGLAWAASKAALSGYHTARSGMRIIYGIPRFLFPLRETRV